MNHEELVGLAKSHFSGVSFEYEGDAVPVLSPCRFTGSEVRCVEIEVFAGMFVVHFLNLHTVKILF